MKFYQYKKWLFSVFTAVTLTVAMSYYTGAIGNDSVEMVKFTDLSDAEIDQIVEVKSTMYAASIETY